MEACQNLLNNLTSRVLVHNIRQSDSLLTACTFFRMRDVHFVEKNIEKYVGTLYGLGADAEVGWLCCQASLYILEC